MALLEQVVQIQFFHQLHLQVVVAEEIAVLLLLVKMEVQVVDLVLVILEVLVVALEIPLL